MRKLIDKLAHRLGYVRWDRTIQGEIEFKENEQPFVNLKLPGGQRLSGWVDNRVQGLHWQPWQPFPIQPGDHLSEY